MPELTFDVALALYQDAEQFPINFDDAWQWLEYSRKDSAKRFLTDNFIKGVDFHILVGSDNHAGLSAQEIAIASRQEQIKLTVTCLKEWGMMAGTARGKEIRRYFIECERIAKEQSIPQLAIAPEFARTVALVQSAKAVGMEPLEFWKLQQSLSGNTPDQGCLPGKRSPKFASQPKSPESDMNHYLERIIKLSRISPDGWVTARKLMQHSRRFPSAQSARSFFKLLAQEGHGSIREKDYGVIEWHP
jgi:phage anti-repressor protein